MVKLVIFDLDGTLLNTISDLAVSTNYALHQHGFPEHKLSQYPYFVGNGINKLIERALPPSEQNEERILELRQDFVTYYDLHKTDLTCPYPGISELLRQLHEMGILLAVASNKYHEASVTLIKHFFPDIPFNVVFGQREGIPVKPNPAIINDILAHTGVTPQETLYIGDSGVDMQTASKSNLQSVGVTWGFRPRSELEEQGAIFIVDRPEEIIPLCLKYPL